MRTRLREYLLALAALVGSLLLLGLLGLVFYVSFDSWLTYHLHLYVALRQLWWLLT